MADRRYRLYLGRGQGSCVGVWWRFCSLPRYFRNQWRQNTAYSHGNCLPLPLTLSFSSHRPSPFPLPLTSSYHHTLPPPPHIITPAITLPSPPSPLTSSHHHPFSPPPHIITPSPCTSTLLWHADLHTLRFYSSDLLDYI